MKKQTLLIMLCVLILSLSRLTTTFATENTNINAIQNYEPRPDIIKSRFNTMIMPRLDLTVYLDKITKTPAPYPYENYEMLHGYPLQNKFQIYINYTEGMSTIKVQFVDLRGHSLDQEVTWRENGKTKKKTRRKLYQYFSNINYQKYPVDYLEKTFGELYYDWVLTNWMNKISEEIAVKYIEFARSQKRTAFKTEKPVLTSNGELYTDPKFGHQVLFPSDWEVRKIDNTVYHEKFFKETSRFEMLSITAQTTTADDPYVNLYLLDEEEKQELLQKTYKEIELNYDSPRLYSTKYQDIGDYHVLYSMGKMKMDGISMFFREGKILANKTFYTIRHLSIETPISFEDDEYFINFILNFKPKPIS